MTAQLRLGLPGAGTTDFATSPIPALTFDEWDETGIPTRRPLGFTAIGQRSNWGTAALVGPAHRVLYAWDVVTICTVAEARQLGALALWQVAQQKAGNLGALRLIDETDYLDSEASPHSHTLLATLTETWNAGYVYGYGVFPVQLSLPEEWKRPVGLAGDGTPLVRVGFSLEVL